MVSLKDKEIFVRSANFEDVNNKRILTDSVFKTEDVAEAVNRLRNRISHMNLDTRKFYTISNSQLVLDWIEQELGNFKEEEK